MSVKITWLGHAAFELTIDGRTVVIDPFLTGNPAATTTAGQLNPQVILLSHAHGDHLGDTVALAKRTGAMVVANYEIGVWLQNNGVKNVAALNPGGTYKDKLLQARLTIARHSSSFADGTYGGEANGFVVTIGKFKLYFAGDTDVFMDMQLIGDLGIDVALLPIGGKFTMGPDEALRAIQLVRPKVVIPMHYNTFPFIEQDAAAWGERVDNETDTMAIVLRPGESYTVG